MSYGRDMEKTVTRVDLGDGNTALVIGGAVFLCRKEDPTPPTPEPDPVINQCICWDTHGDPNARGNVRRGGYITALPSTPDGHYSIRADAGEMQYIKRDQFIAHRSYDGKPMMR